jgi:hypothetical protein
LKKPSAPAFYTAVDWSEGRVALENLAKVEYGYAGERWGQQQQFDFVCLSLCCVFPTTTNNAQIIPGEIATWRDCFAR